MIAFTRVTDGALDPAAHIAAVSTPAHGAIATFVGTVRDHDPGVRGRVVGLDYSCHPSAADVLRSITQEHDASTRSIAISHRIGSLEVGEIAIVAAVASAHRREAMDTLAILVEDVKERLPMWKRERLDDGSHTWVGVQ